MGFYVQPKIDLWQWLQENGHPVNLATIERFVYDPDPLATLPVCWVDNGAFQAAGIAYDYHELVRFRAGIGGREHQWFLVPKDMLKPWLPSTHRRGE